MATHNVSIEDLEFAVTWLADGYEAADDDPNGPAAQRVAAWLRAEIARRTEAANVRAVVASTGVTPARARDALRRAVANGLNGPVERRP